MFQTMNSVRSDNIDLKYQRFTPSGCKDIRKLDFVGKLGLFLRDSSGKNNFLLLKTALLPSVALLGLAET